MKQFIFANAAFFQGTWQGLTSPPSSLKIAEDPIESDGIIFLLHRRRRNVSEERSFLWNFQPMREEYSQPSTGSRLCRRNKKFSVFFHLCSPIPPPSAPSPQREQSGLISSFVVGSVSSYDGRGTFSLLQPTIWVCHQVELLFHIPNLEVKVQGHNWDGGFPKPPHKEILRETILSFVMLPFSSTALLLSKLQSSSQLHPGGHSNAPRLWVFSPF